MPKAEFYANLSAADTLDKLAEHHYDKKRRHISEFEYLEIKNAATIIRALHNSVRSDQNYHWTEHGWEYKGLYHPKEND